jgi:hypothetical protein
VLGLVSASSAKILRMEFRSDEKGQLVEPSDFISKLRDWWRDKVMDDKGWERWSSHVTVNWVAAHSNEDRALFYPFFGGGG